MIHNFFSPKGHSTWSWTAARSVSLQVSKKVQMLQGIIIFVVTHSIAQNTRLSEPTTKVWMKIDVHYQGKNVAQWLYFLALSGLCGYSRWFPGEGTSNDSGAINNSNFHQRFRWLFLRKLYRLDQHYYVAIGNPSSTFHRSQNAWPWMILNGYLALNCFRASMSSVTQCDIRKLRETNKDRSILLSGPHKCNAATIQLQYKNFLLYCSCIALVRTASAAQVFDRDSSFWRYKVYADICGVL